METSATSLRVNPSLVPLRRECESGFFGVGGAASWSLQPNNSLELGLGTLVRIWQLVHARRSSSYYVPRANYIALRHAVPGHLLGQPFRLAATLKSLLLMLLLLPPLLLRRLLLCWFG